MELLLLLFPNMTIDLSNKYGVHQIIHLAPDFVSFASLGEENPHFPYNIDKLKGFKYKHVGKR